MKTRAVAAATLIVLCLPAVNLVGMSPASAAAGGGASFRCDVGGAHCVEGSGQSENAGTSTTGGKAVALCQGNTSGAILTEVTCSVGGVSNTTTLPGPTGASEAIADTDTFTRLQVCWTVTGYFYNPFGPLDPLSTSGCSLIAL